MVEQRGIEIYFRPEFNKRENTADPGSTRADQIINAFIENPKVCIRNPLLLDYWSTQDGQDIDRSLLFLTTAYHLELDPEQLIRLALAGDAEEIEPVF
jgi:hypothetical protein